MSETNIQNSFKNETDQSLEIANSARDTVVAEQSAQVIEFPAPVAEQPIETPFPSDAEHVEPETTETSPDTAKKVGKLAGLAAAGALLAGSFLNGLGGDKEPTKPEEPVGVSDVSQPYQLGSESVDGNKIDTTSEVALQVTENIPGEQGGLDVVARDINERTAENETNSISETVWVPENADVVPDKSGVQLVEQPTDKSQQ